MILSSKKHFWDFVEKINHSCLIAKYKNFNFSKNKCTLFTHKQLIDS